MSIVLGRLQSELKEHNNVKLLAVSKKQSAASILELYNRGVRDFGENYIQELLEKSAELPKDIIWHLIGPLQKNKAKYCPGLVKYLHSLSSLELAEELNKKFLASNQILKVFIQINLSQESSKNGLTNISDLKDFATRLLDFKNLDLIGLMTMPDPNFNEQQTLNTYRELVKLQQNLKLEFKDSYNINEVSAGMSADYKLAIKAGATIVRIGSLIFGQRSTGEK